MSVNSIQQMSFSVVHIPRLPDEEHLRIIRRLRELGISPTGDKYQDKALLRQAEIQLLKAEKAVSVSYITISLAEQQKILEEEIKKKEDSQEVSQEEKQNNELQEKRDGATLLGQQLFTMVQYKKKKYQ